MGRSARDPLHPLYAVLSGTIGLSTWWPLLGGRLGESLAAVHRSAGDSQYLPLLSGLARFNFGDSQVWEARGQGWMSFPLAPLVPHAVGLRLFGGFGLLVVDVAVAVLYYFIGRALLLALGLERRLAGWVSIVSLFACFGGLLEPFYQLGVPLGLYPNPSVVWPLSAMRFPRPWVTDVFLLLALLSLVRLLTARRFHAGLTAFSAVALLQADI
jgi:hypothetical protein